MKEKDLRIILQEGEGYKIEFKENLSRAIVEDIVAFTNASGGRIFLGISDEGKIKGIKITNKLKSQIQDSARNCDPKIEVFLEGYNDILRQAFDKRMKIIS
jgi:ATP-dependent DNA helicase RecG